MVKRYLKLIVFSFVTSFMLFMYGCGGGGSLSSSPGTQPASVKVSIENQYQVVEPDGTTRVPISVSVYNGNGDLMNKVKVEIALDPNIGSFDSYIKTTENGKATFLYTVPSDDTIQAYNTNIVRFIVSVLGYDVTDTFELHFKVFMSKIISTVPDNSTILPADENIKVPVTVYAYGENGKPMGAVNIYASASPNIGSFNSPVSLTSAAGIAKFTYTLPSKDEAEKARTNKVILSFCNEDKTVKDNVTINFDNIQIGNGLPAAVLISAQPSMILAAGVSSGPKISQITARVVDSAGNTINSGYNVKFSVLQAPNGTYITPSEVSITNGVAIADVVSGNISGTVLIRATVEGYANVVSSSAIVYVTTGQASKITLLESGKIIAQDDNGTRSQNIYAFVKDVNGAPVADGTVVYFSLNDSCGGMIQQQGVTSNGVASATLLYPAQCIWKSYNIYAETSGGGISGILNGSYPAVSPVSLALAGPHYIGASGGYLNVVATLKDEGGNGLAIQDANIMFSSSADNVTFSPKIATTDSGGMASTTVYIPPLDNTTLQRTVTITGQSGSAIDSLSVVQK